MVRVVEFVVLLEEGFDFEVLEGFDFEVLEGFDFEVLVDFPVDYGHFLIKNQLKSK